MNDSSLFRQYIPAGKEHLVRSDSLDLIKSKRTQPSTNAKERSYMRRLEEAKDKHTQLYLEGQIAISRKLQKSRLAERAVDPECTFKPAIQPVALELPNFEVRQNIWEERRKNKLIDEVSREQERQMEDCSFRPRLHRPERRSRTACRHQCETPLTQQPAKSRTKRIGEAEYSAARKLIHQFLNK